MEIDLLSLLDCSVKASLLLYLCKNSIALKEKYRSVGRVLFFLQTFLTGYIMSNSRRIDRLIYGNAMGQIRDSAYSIVKLVIIFCCSFLMMDWLYQGRRLAKLYLLLVFYTVREMARFAMHSIWSLAMAVYVDHLNERLLTEAMEPEYFLRRTEYLQTYSQWIFVAGYVSLMYAVLRRYRRYLAGNVNEINRQGLCFLMLAPFIGMAFDVSWRISLFRQRGTEIEFLYDRHGSMYAVVPTIAALCLVCTVFSRKIYSELMDSEAQKNRLLFYKQQLADMTEHVKELEQLYDGIRGMRHDVHNYVADMEQLLAVSVGSGQLPDRIRQEAEGYLWHMRQAADRLSLQFATGNPVTDVILNRKGQICIQEQIKLEGEFIFPAQLEIEAFDLGILLNNALDNAVEACRKVSADSERRIYFRGYTKGRMFFLTVENSYDGKVLSDAGKGLLTTKEDRKMHGFGMSNMRSCAEKYYGTIQYEMGKEKFVLTVMMQGNISVCD